MNIWLINHYAVPLKYWPGNRTPQFAKYLLRAGHNVRVIAASTVHNSDVNLISDEALYREETVDGVPYTYIKCPPYRGNGIKRIINMLAFPFRLDKIYQKFSDRPDVVLGSSLTPFACVEAIRIARHYKAKSIAEIRDLWPESAIAYGLIGKHNPVLIPMRFFEKKMYEYADEIIFSMEGAYDYIRERGWEKDIPQSKVHYINNGVDLEVFDYNREHYRIDDEDLRDSETFKVIYTGSIRRANNVGKILDIAKRFENENIKFLIYGSGDEVEILKQRLKDENTKNVVFKGGVEKKYVPYITSNADLNLMDMQENNEIFKYGISPNKLFDYFAAKKPIVMYQLNSYNPAIDYKVGFVGNSMDEIVEIIKGIMNKSSQYIIPEERFEIASKAYSYEELVNKYLSPILVS